MGPPKAPSARSKPSNGKCSAARTSTSSDAASSSAIEPTSRTLRQSPSRWQVNRSLIETVGTQARRSVADGADSTLGWTSRQIACRVVSDALWLVRRRYEARHQAGPQGKGLHHDGELDTRDQVVAVRGRCADHH